MCYDIARGEFSSHLWKIAENKEMAPDKQTKRCIYCGEEILIDAIKCRYCKEFLEEEDSLPVSRHAVPQRNGRQTLFPSRYKEPTRTPAPQAHPMDKEVRIVPSLWGMVGITLTSLIFLLIAILLMGLPLEKYLGPKIMNGEYANIAVQGIHLTGFVVAVIAVMRIVFRALQLKSTRYDLGPDRIEWTRGIFSRHVDNIDMFRVIDLKLHRSLLDCLLGIGSVTLVTKDETDPVFEFEKVRHPRTLYDLIKNASLAADRKQGVVHIE